MSVTAPWSLREYQRIASVSHQGDDLVVCFEDGSCVQVDAQRVLPPDTRGAAWDAMAVDPYEIAVPTAEGQVEVPWSTIRALTDRAYAGHLAAAAREEARQIGRRIKELREGRHLSSKELAERAGLAPQSLSRIEHGRHDVTFTTLRRILAAMGCSMKDLATPPREPASHSVPEGSASGGQPTIGQ
ncbi:MAG: helix-turn-helix transcriptional regulator [Chloroflexi bacterium]|nr:helix-turn-helix transcriptional regulator [Chloroflexota bacterium]